MISSRMVLQLQNLQVATVLETKEVHNNLWYIDTIPSPCINDNTTAVLLSGFVLKRAMIF